MKEFFYKFDKEKTSNIQVMEFCNNPKQKVHDDFGLWICFTSRGHKSPPPKKILPRIFNYYSISHMYDGKGFSWRESGKVQHIKSGDVILTAPGHLNCFGGDNDLYVEDSICFKGPLANNLYKSGVFKEGIFHLGQLRRLLPIIDLAMTPSKNRQIEANIELQKLLFEIITQNNQERLTSSELLIHDLIEEINKNPMKWWTSREMAEYCNLSEGHFRRSFRKQTGQSPKKYIDYLKIQKASELIMTTDASFSKIAEQFGFIDHFHFRKRFKEIIGMPPGKYRNLRKPRA